MLCWGIPIVLDIVAHNDTASYGVSLMIVKMQIYITILIKIIIDKIRHGFWCFWSQVIEAQHVLYVLLPPSIFIYLPNTVVGLCARFQLNSNFNLSSIQYPFPIIFMGMFFFALVLLFLLFLVFFFFLIFPNWFYHTLSFLGCSTFLESCWYLNKIHCFIWL